MPKRVLVVDDSDIIRTAMRLLLDLEPGVSVCGEARSVQEAVSLLEQVRPDIVILDLSMPGTDGLQGAKVLREHTPGLPIILYTLHAAEISKEDLARDGMTAVVAKGDLAELLREIRYLVKNKP